MHDFLDFLFFLNFIVLSLRFFFFSLINIHLRLCSRKSRNVLLLFLCCVAKDAFLSANPFSIVKTCTTLFMQFTGLKLLCSWIQRSACLFVILPRELRNFLFFSHLRLRGYKNPVVWSNGGFFNIPNCAMIVRTFISRWCGANRKL